MNASFQPTRNSKIDADAASIDSLCARFQSEWRNGGRPSIETYLESAPESLRSQLADYLLSMELEQRRRAGEIPQRVDYATRFASYKRVLERHFPSALAETAQIDVGSPAAETLPPRETSSEKPTTSQNDDSEDDTGQRFGDYDLLEEIARGGMGVVYKARQRKAHRTVALKMIRAGRFADENEVRRFYVEAAAVANLEHPHIVPVFDVGEQDGQHYFSMGYVEGGSLKDRTAEGPLPDREAAEIVKTIAEAIAHAHERGIIHRDLKPANVLIGRDGKPRVTDFGLAKHLEGESSLTATGQVMGTPSYMAPEQAEGQNDQIGPLVDVYALGAILYELLTGRPPFQAPSAWQTIGQVLTRDPVAIRELNPAVAIDLETICLKCLEKSPERRLASARELSEELGRFLRGEPVRVRPLGRLQQTWRWCRRNPTVSGLAAAVLVSLILGIGVSTYFALLAGQRAQRAQQGTRIAVNTLQSVIYTVQQKLRNIPQAREVRRELLKSSLSDLEKISAEFEIQQQVDHPTAVALLDLGRLFQEIGTESGEGASQSAERNFQNSVEIFRQLLARDPSSIAAKQDLCSALERLTSLYLYAERYSDVQQPLQELVTLCRERVRAEPDDLRHQFELSCAIIDWGDAIVHSGRDEETLAAYEEGLSIAREINSRKPDVDDYSRILSAGLEKLGDFHLDRGRPEPARNAYQEQFEINKKRVERLPESVDSLLSLSMSYERMGELYTQLQQHEKARDNYIQMRDYTIAAAKGDPENQQLQVDLAMSYEKVGDVAVQLKDLPAAEEAYVKAAEILAEQSRRDGTNHRIQRLLQMDQSRLTSVRGQIEAANRPAP